MTSLRTLTITGTPRERGRVHGEELRELVHLGVARAHEAIAASIDGPAEAFFTDFLAAIRVQDTIAQWTPDLLDEVRGIAEGAGLPFEMIFAYNLVDEMWTWAADSGYGKLLAEGASRERCTAVALAVGPNGHPIVAQNMDIPVQYAGTEVLLHVASDTRPDALVLTAAGLIATCGANELGVAVCTNTLLAVSHARSGLPVLFAVRSALQQRDFAGALAHLRAIPHVSGQNFVIGGPDGIGSLEASSKGVAAYAEGADRIGHANHPLALEDVDEAALAYDQPSTGERQAFLDAHLGAARTAGDVKALLSDRTVPVCKHGVELGDSTTWCSIVMELSAPPTIEVSVGPPDLNPYEQVWPPR